MRIRLERIQGELNQTVEASFNWEAERVEWSGTEKEEKDVGKVDEAGNGGGNKEAWSGRDSHDASSVITIRNRRNRQPYRVSVHVRY